MLPLREQKNPKKQGDIGLMVAAEWFVRNGYHVSLPLSDSQDYDLVAETGGKFYGVQVRTTYRKVPSGAYEAHLRVCGGNRSGTGKVKHFDSITVDYLFVLTEMGDKYLIPKNAIEARSAITLSEKYAQYKVE